VPSGTWLVTSAPCTRKENSVQHQIRFHSIVAPPLHQRNLAAFSPAAFDARHRFFPGSQIHRQRRGWCHGYFSSFSRSFPSALIATSPDDFGDVDGCCLTQSMHRVCRGGWDGGICFDVVVHRFLNALHAFVKNLPTFNLFERHKQSNNYETNSKKPLPSFTEKTEHTT